MSKSNQTKDQIYLDTILKPIRVCANYRPRLGLGNKVGLDLSGFQKLYLDDPFYTWFGLDNPLMYSAHKAAGGMTSIYRQIGIGCEKLFQKILQDELSLSTDQTHWSYSVTVARNRKRTLSLDARIRIDDIPDENKRERIRAWLSQQAQEIKIQKQIANNLNGIVFEVRQGYKSKDSKRQNADIANATNAYINAYLPCVIVFSNQIDEDIVVRYRMEKWAIFTARPNEKSVLNSTYLFMKDIIGYDLSSFFERHSKILRDEINTILHKLLDVE
jgi:hypothetical protein